MNQGISKPWIKGDFLLALTSPLVTASQHSCRSRMTREHVKRGNIYVGHFVYKGFRDKPLRPRSSVIIFDSTVKMLENAGMWGQNSVLWKMVQ